MDRPTGLALYHFSGCPYCSRVRSAAAALGVELPLRDILADPASRAELIKATGRQTVPCLRIEDAAGHVRWMHESLDIIDFLKEHFA